MKKSVILIVVISTFLIIISGFAVTTAVMSEETLSYSSLNPAEEEQSGLVFIPSSHNFGDVSCNDYRTYGLEIKNDGAFHESGQVYVVSGGPPFTCISGCSYSIPPGESHYYATIKFEPFYEGTANSTVYAGTASASVSGNSIVTSPDPKNDPYCEDL